MEIEICYRSAAYGFVICLVVYLLVFSPIVQCLISNNLITFVRFVFAGGHKEFHSRHKDMCDNSLLPAPPIVNGSCPQDVNREMIDTQPLTKLLPFLYLGNSKDADDRDGMSTIGITRVLNVTTSQQSPSPVMDHRTSGVVYKRLSVLDSSHANLKQYFEEAFDFIGKSTRIILYTYLFIKHESF